MDVDDCISARGVSFLPEVPKFFDVLNDLWHPEKNPEGILNLGLAENVGKRRLPSIRADSHALTYGDGFTGSKLAKEALCQFLNQQLKPFTPLAPPHLSVTPGMGNALECCAWSLFEHGDQVLVGRPYWTAFSYIFGIRAGVGVREVSFGTVDPFSLEAVQEYEKEYTRAQEDSKTVKAILLCSPHNPLGRCYSNQVLKAYMSLCGKLGLHLLADEIYGLSVFENPEMDDPVPFTSILSINPEGLMDPRKVHTQWGFSKDFGATGLRIGCVISQSNRPFLKSLESFSLADKVAVSLLTDQEYIQKYIATYRSRLAESYRHVAQFLKEHEIPYRTSNASLFLMVHLSAMVPSQSVTDDDILALLRKEKVYAISGTAYRSEEPGWFRVVIAHPKYVLDEGLKRMLRALSQS
ncbi:Aminotran-1-2 domain-containing protein [Fusarium falciforme]|uniref:Aminotran-1-2 domain-containing protein n=1 Tax=Fusarium falciforme TaxID=195108 RepID=UPI00230126E7|nr:Aminotran-1-2 domain-containing protein [Fusarium falciforme]WAO96908.1 Aminotran-1-2 domain-containing protein [Fusarium falciforme]